MMLYGFPVSSRRRGVVISGRKDLSVSAVATETPGSDDYNARMKRQMMNPYEYHHELGNSLDFNLVLPVSIVRFRAYPV